MKKGWALTGNKAIINFSQNYCNSHKAILESEGFRSVLEHYLEDGRARKSQTYKFIASVVNVSDIDLMIKELVHLSKLFTIMNSKEISERFKSYENLYDNRNKFRKFVEEVYTFWRNLERYAIIYVSDKTEGFLNTTFMESKENFDKLIITLYRKISNNVSLTKPTVYRQLPAGSNVAMVVYDAVWPIPKGYEILSDICFVEEIILQAPFITYPKYNTRDGFFNELPINPLKRCGINADKFFAFAVMVGDLLAYVFVERDFLTHGVSLANLFEMPSQSEISGKKPDLLVIFGGEDHRDEVVSGYYDDAENDIMVGYVSANERHDYFGYMKKIILTLNNLANIKKGRLPIHGAMVSIVLNNGDSANVAIVGDSGAGKSESIEAFRALGEDNISEMTIIFDDMGTFVKKDNQILAYGTETGAFVRLDDLEAGYAFKELDRSIFMNPDRINSRLITPVSTYEEIIKGIPVDILLYANNYQKLDKDIKALTLFNDIEIAKKIFIEGKRMAKGTTTEKGISTSFFANPFGPYQKQAETLEIIDEIFESLEANGTLFGQINTQLGIEAMEKDGPIKASKDLLDLIRKINRWLEWKYQIVLLTWSIQQLEN